MKLQVTIGDQRGLDIGMLRGAIETHYRSVTGKRVRVIEGRGVGLNGIPIGTWRLKDIKSD